MAVEKQLTPRNIRYLLAMHQLGASHRGIRCVDLARSLNISKPSAHAMLQSFSQQGLVRKEKAGSIFLSPKGAEIALHYWARSLHLSKALLPLLGLSEDDCLGAACILLAEFDQKLQLLPAGEG